MVIAILLCARDGGLSLSARTMELMRNAYGSWVQDLTLLMYEASGIDINTKRY